MRMGPKQVARAYGAYASAGARASRELRLLFVVCPGADARALAGLRAGFMPQRATAHVDVIAPGTGAAVRGRSALPDAVAVVCGADPDEAAIEARVASASCDHVAVLAPRGARREVEEALSLADAQRAEVVAYAPQTACDALAAWLSAACPDLRDALAAAFPCCLDAVRGDLVREAARGNARLAAKPGRPGSRSDAMCAAEAELALHLAAIGKAAGGGAGAAGEDGAVRADDDDDAAAGIRGGRAPADGADDGEAGGDGVFARGPLRGAARAAADAAAGMAGIAVASAGAKRLVKAIERRTPLPRLLVRPAVALLSTFALGTAFSAGSARSARSAAPAAGGRPAAGQDGPAAHDAGDVDGLKGAARDAAGYRDVARGANGTGTDDAGAADARSRTGRDQ